MDNKIDVNNIRKVVENMRWCCGDRDWNEDDDEDGCFAHCINPKDSRDGFEPRFCRQWLMRDAADIIEALLFEIESKH